MYKYIPTMYKKSIFDISYDLLKSKGIKYLLFDLDNTILLAKKGSIENDSLNLIKKLKNSFTIILVSNSGKKRVSTVANILGIDYIASARKPSNKAFREIVSRYNCKKEEMVLIGDQLLTDVKGGNKFGIVTILVDRLGPDRWITYPNRIIEHLRLKFLTKRKLLERGKYYE